MCFGNALYKVQQQYRFFCLLRIVNFNLEKCLGFLEGKIVEHVTRAELPEIVTCVKLKKHTTVSFLPL
jgi:hypothetical protein